MAVSVRDVARAAGVSVGTVSNVLNGKGNVSATTAEKVRTAIASLGFVRNDAARQLRAGRSRSIGLVVLDAGNPFFADVARGAEARASEAGMTVLLGTSDQNVERERSYLDLFREQRVNGVLLTPARHHPESVDELVAAGIPVVLVDAESSSDTLWSVSVDDEEGGRMAVQHLLDQHHTRIALVGGPITTPQVAQRFRGARHAIGDARGAHVEIIDTPELTVLAGREAGAAIAARPAADRPSAVFCANDLLAVGFLQGASILGGVRVPEELAIIGYDDIDFSATSVVPLSTVRQPAREIGASAVSLLLEALADPDDPPRSVRFQPELVIRESTGGQSQPLRPH